MVRQYTAASAAVVALAFGGLFAASAFATSGLAPSSGEASATPHASPGKTTRADARRQVPPARADGTLGTNVGEASAAVERPRASTRTRDQVKQEARASRSNRKSADGLEQVGGEAGSRSGPR